MTLNVKGELVDEKQNGDDRARLPRRRERLEQQARARGYQHEWPPVKYVVNSPKDFARVLARVEGGELKASSVYTLGRTALTFVEALRPEDFRRLGHLLVTIVRDKNAADRTRLRAAQAVLTQIPHTIELLKTLQRSARPAPVQHIEVCLLAFVEAVGQGEIENMVAELRRLAETKRGRTAALAVRATEALLKLAADLAKALATLSYSVDYADHDDPETRRRMAEADAKLAEIEARIEAKRAVRGEAATIANSGNARPPRRYK